MSPIKSIKDNPLIDLCSGVPWHLRLTITRVGDDLLCRIHGGVEHVGATALGQWDGQCATVQTLTVDRHKEGPLAALVGHQLCQASQTTVACLAGIHYDGIDKPQIEDIRQAVWALSARAARQLEQLRITQK